MTPAEKGQPGSPEGHRERLAAIGKAIRLRRVEVDMKRAELAERAGLSYAYVAEIENGTKQASSKALWALAESLGLEPHELLALAALVGGSERAAGSKEPESAVSTHLRRLRVASTESPSTGRFDTLGRARMMSVGPPPPAASGPEPSAAGPRRSSWFHGTLDAAPGAAPGGADQGDADEGGREPAEPPDLPGVLARLETALDGVPGERAELALMLALDDRRTRRIVREELDRRRPRA